MSYVEKYRQRVSERRQRIEARWASLRAMYAIHGNFHATAKAAGCDPKTVMYAVSPDYAEKRKEQMRFRYYLNNVLPRELEAEAAE